MTSPLPSSTTCEARHRVLLVDDDAVSLDLMALLLAYEGHEVLRAHDAGSALELLAAENGGRRPDVLLVDLQMPGVSGGQLAERVRALKGPEPLLLAMSATGVRQQQLLAFDGFLLKPLALGDLGRALRPPLPSALPSQRRGRRKPVVRTAHPRKKGETPGNAVDMAVVNKLLAMMPAQSLQDLVTACIADSRACVDAIRNHTRSGGDAQVSGFAHRIKGAASMIGATRLGKLAANIERGGSKEAATPGVLEDLLRACGELERMLFAGKFTKTRAPQHDNYDHRNAGQ